MKDRIMNDKVVFFDLDDTLIIEKASAEKSLIAASKHAQKEYGINPNRLHESVLFHARELWHKMPTYQYCFDIGISSWEGLWAKFIGENQNLKELNKLVDQYQTDSWYLALKDFKIKDKPLARELSRLFHEYRRKRHILFPEVIKVLKEIYKVYHIGLITNGLPELQWQKIKGVGIELYFENIIISGEINFRKPNEEIFLLAIKRFNITKENCVMVGNSLNSDILGANNVGIYSIWINRRNKEKIKSEIKPNKIITSLLELPEIIKKYFQK